MVNNFVTSSLPPEPTWWVNFCLETEHPLFIIPASAVRSQLQVALNGHPPVKMGRSTYPKRYYNRDGFFPRSRDYMELPIGTESLLLNPPVEPGPVRVIYNRLTGALVGVLAYPYKKDSTFIVSNFSPQVRLNWAYDANERWWVSRRPGAPPIYFAFGASKSASAPPRGEAWKSIFDGAKSGTLNTKQSKAFQLHLPLKSCRHMDKGGIQIGHLDRGYLPHPTTIRKVIQDWSIRRAGRSPG
ncbi:hypothetical protein V8E54_012968 [Elaphomyces granulatus]